MIGKVCTSAAFVFLATLGALQARPVVLLPVYLIRDDVSKVWWGDCWRDHGGRVHCAVAGTAPAATCIAHAIWPRRYRAPPFRCCEN